MSPNRRLSRASFQMLCERGCPRHISCLTLFHAARQQSVGLLFVHNICLTQQNRPQCRRRMCSHSARSDLCSLPFMPHEDTIVDRRGNGARMRRLSVPWHGRHWTLTRMVDKPKRYLRCGIGKRSGTRAECFTSGLKEESRALCPQHPQSVLSLKQSGNPTRT